MDAEVPLEIDGRFSVPMLAAGLAGVFSEAGCECGVCSMAGGGRPRPMRPVSAISASGVVASGAGAEGSSGASVTSASLFGECLGALGGGVEDSEAFPPDRKSVV